MADEIIKVSDDFWNIRGDFRIGVLNIGTQCSLVRLRDGRFVFLDSYALTGEIREQVMAVTDGGNAVEAILNVHPFHTVHCAQMAKDFPGARFYGSSRHKSEVSEVNWEAQRVESEAVAAQYPEFSFSLPDGIDYISDDESVHAGSLLVYHEPSGALHVDDTFNVLPVPSLIRKILPITELSFHPKLKAAMQDAPNAGKQFCDWAERIARDWSSTQTLCAAHSRIARFEPGGFSRALLTATQKTRPKLARRAS